MELVVSDKGGNRSAYIVVGLITMHTALTNCTCLPVPAGHDKCMIAVAGHAERIIRRDAPAFLPDVSGAQSVIRHLVFTGIVIDDVVSDIVFSVVFDPAIV